MIVFLTAKANALYETQALIDLRIMQLIFLTTASLEVNEPSKFLE
jgi:hypothetical protein